MSHHPAGLANQLRALLTLRKGCVGQAENFFWNPRENEVLIAPTKWKLLFYFYVWLTPLLGGWSKDSWAHLNVKSTRFGIIKMTKNSISKFFISSYEVDLISAPSIVWFPTTVLTVTTSHWLGIGNEPGLATKLFSVAWIWTYISIIDTNTNF